MKTGEFGTGQWSHTRWCEPCGHYHGAAYICPEYPEAVRAEVAECGARFRANLADSDWRARQIERGVPPHVIAIFIALAGD